MPIVQFFNKLQMVRFKLDLKLLSALVWWRHPYPWTYVESISLSLTDLFLHIWIEINISRLQLMLGKPLDSTVICLYLESQLMSDIIYHYLHFLFQLFTRPTVMLGLPSYYKFKKINTDKDLPLILFFLYECGN